MSRLDVHAADWPGACLSGAFSTLQLTLPEMKDIWKSFLSH